ncbi:MAG: hypothetical protein IH586_16400 [Anaerolineaceae bacterium]|nr:hypothetical protein [Anaerolineaceae bacterium]
MADFDTIQAQASQLIEKQPPDLPEIRKLMVEMDEFFNSPDFQALAREERTQLQNTYKELRALVRGPESSGAQPATAGAFTGTGFNLGEVSGGETGRLKYASTIPRPSRR